MSLLHTRKESAAGSWMRSRSEPGPVTPARLMCRRLPPSRGSCTLHVGASLSKILRSEFLLKGMNAWMVTPLQSTKKMTRKTPWKHSPLTVYRIWTWQSESVTIGFISWTHRCILTTPVWSASSDSARLEAEYLNPHNKAEPSHRRCGLLSPRC